VADPTQLPPIELELDDIQLLSTNTVWVRLQFGDETQIALEFPPDSPLARSLLELLERGANEMLNRLGRRTIKVSGFTPAAAEDDE
jgi:hypothetical protein